MAAGQDASTGALLFKVYGDVANPLPEDGTVAKLIKFVPPTMRTGKDFNFQINTGFEQGVTRALNHNVNTLNAAEDGTYEMATLEGAELIIRAQLSYGSIARMSKNKGRSNQAQDQEVGLKIANTTAGLEQHREMDLLYGPGTAGLGNIGVVNAVAVAAASGVVTINITRASWIPAFWRAFKNGRVDVYSSGGALRNTLGFLQVTAVNAQQCRVTLTSAVAPTNTDAAAVQAGDVLFFYLGRQTSMVGIQPILENTGSLFGINAANNPSWKGESYSVGGTLTFDKVQEGVSQVGDNGVNDGLVVLLNPRTWTDLMTDEAALRRYVGERSDTAKPGFGEITYKSAAGDITFMQHHFIKQGIAIGLHVEDWNRVGSTDITYQLNDGTSNQFFAHQIPSATGVEIRAYTDQAVVSEVPARSILFTNITNSSDNLPS